MAESDHQVTNTAADQIDVRREVHDALKHMPGWGEHNIVNDLKRRLSIEPDVTISVIGQMAQKGELKRSPMGDANPPTPWYISLPEN